MKPFLISSIAIAVFIFNITGEPIMKPHMPICDNHVVSHIRSEKDTCIIEGMAFKMSDYRSTKIMRAYIKNGQIYVVNDGLQFAKFRIIQYVFSSLTNEQMPSFRYFNQRISPPIINILKYAKVGEQYLFEEIVVVDEQNNILTNEVRPFVIERINN